MRWLGWSKRCLEIAQEYVGRREGFGIKLADRESVQIKLGEVAQQIEIGRLLTMHAAWMLDQGGRARKEVSMAKVQVADTLHKAADVAIQLQGARGFSKDTIVEWVYRAARAARLVDGAIRSAHDGAVALPARGRPRFLALGPGRGATERALDFGRPGRAKRGPGPILRSLSRGHGLWVPAFAGTTNRPTAHPSAPGALRRRCRRGRRRKSASSRSSPSRRSRNT